MVGTGITAISQITLEAVGYIQRADVVFYHVTNGPAATHIRKLNPNAVDLYEYYGEGKKRRITYVEMAELMLREVRRGLTVVGVFHGHPGYFVSPARRALAIASIEGHETATLPGVSAPDCMFSDLRVDPGVFGCQILMASRIFREDCILATTGHVVFLQVGAVGDSGFSFSGYKNSKLSEFIEKLISVYGEEQDSIYYMASIFPGFDPEIVVRTLSEYRDPTALATIGSGVLYLPPRGVTVSSLVSLQAFTGDQAYGPFESKVVAKLDQHSTPPEYRLRRASDSLYRALYEIGTSPQARESYLCSPGGFVSQFPELSKDERSALECRSLGAVRAVSTFLWSTYKASYPAANAHSEPDANPCDTRTITG
jgi:precorrin-2 methylase